MSDKFFLADFSRCKIVTTIYAAQTDPALLTADTSPSAIAADQLRDVSHELHSIRQHWSRFGCRPLRTQLIECVTNALDLHAWVTERKLCELGAISEAVPLLTKAEKKQVGSDRVKAVATFLKTLGRYATLEEISTGTGLSRSTVKNVLSWQPTPFKRVVIDRSERLRKRGIFMYQNVGFAVPVKVGVA